MLVKSRRNLDRFRTKRRTEYPDGDGKPFAESDKHADLMIYCREALRLYFAPRSRDVYVSGNNFIYWKQNDASVSVSPDVYVVFGVRQQRRDCYFVWREEYRRPAVVFEFTSKSTQAEDMNRKFTLHEKQMGVSEYILFDPTGDYLKPQLQGYRLRGGQYAVIESDGSRLHSEELGLDIVQINEDEIRLYDPSTAMYLPTLEEADAAAYSAERRVRQGEAENVRLREELERIRQKISSQPSN